MKTGSYTYAGLLKAGTDYIRQEAISRTAVSDAANDAWYLMEHVFGMNRTEYYMIMNGQIGEMKQETADRYLELVKRRAAGEPLQYITGIASFMGLDFYVTPSVLIPRQDTEILAQKALDLMQNGYNVLDMCSGSGCIALALAYHFKGITCTGADISGEAISIAEKNRDRLMLPQVGFVRSDLFENISADYDMIVSNPPYIRTADIQGLDPEVKDHEPVLALDGSDDGLAFYRRLAAQAADHLKAGGCLIMETGMDQADDVCSILKASGYKDTEVIKDLAGLDRVVLCRSEKR